MRQIPFTTMHHNDGLTRSADDYCLADPGKVYAIYLPKGGTTEVDLGGIPGEFFVQWFDPRSGGAPQTGDVALIEAPGWKSIGRSPAEAQRDWCALVKLVRAKPPRG